MSHVSHGTKCHTTRFKVDRRVWIVTESAYYTERPRIKSVHETKAGAARHCRDDGFTYDGVQGFYCNDGLASALQRDAVTVRRWEAVLRLRALHYLFFSRH